jgi:TM2 domain-containing membrane protein YozV
MIAADPFAPGATNSINSAAFLGSLVSLSALGAGAGKVVNGFICQAIGGRLSGSLYLLSLAIFSTILSTTYTIHGYGEYEIYVRKYFSRLINYHLITRPH